MKYSVLFLASAGLLCAEQFVTGQAARAVIGQETFTRQAPGATQSRLGAVSGVAYANNTLFVVDSSRVQAFPQNNRVLIYRNLDTKFPGPKTSIRLQDYARCPLCGGEADVVVGQEDFEKTEIGLNNSRFRNPTAVATDGRVLAVADTDNNRVLIWNSIPLSNNQAADVVLGQENFQSNAINFGRGSSVNERGLRGPQGVWIDNEGGLWVADTQNHRVLRWNTIPRENGAPANLVLGKPDFTTFVEVNLVAEQRRSARGNNMLNPVSVTTDGRRLFVSDLGYNRVLVWNAIPRQNGQTADFALGQPNVNSSEELDAESANNVRTLCAATGKDADGNDTFPALCNATLNFPRYALSDGNRVFVADGGNNRVLVYNTMPTQSGQPADVVLGQLTGSLDQDSEFLRISAADSVRTPMGLAWDGTNLYVSDPFNRRVMVWTAGDQPLPITGVRNAASREIFAVGNITFTAEPKENDEVTVTIGTGDTKREYKYTAVADDTMARVINALVERINAGAGDPEVFASPNVIFNTILLTSRISGDPGNNIEFTVGFSAGAQITGSGSGKLAGGQDAAKIAPGTLVSILGENLADQTATAPAEANPLPTSLGGVEVYIDGIPAPLLYVSSDQINTQMPWEVNDSSSVNAYVRITGRDGTVRTTTAIAVPIIPQNPGVFAEQQGLDPRPARAMHGSSFAIGVVSVDGAIKAGDQAVVGIEDRNYGYTVKEGDTLNTIRDALVNEINQDPQVEAVPSTVFTRILLRARTQGTAGENITYSASATEGGSLILTPLSPRLCCAKTEGAQITQSNPANPGQLIKIYATGLGLVGPDEAKFANATGFQYSGPRENSPNTFVDAIAGGKTANVIHAGLVPGMVGVYELILQLNSDIPTNPQTQLTIAQDIYVSNIVTFPVVNPDEVTTEP